MDTVLHLARSETCHEFTPSCRLAVPPQVGRDPRDLWMGGRRFLLGEFGHPARRKKGTCFRYLTFDRWISRFFKDEHRKRRTQSVPPWFSVGATPWNVHRVGLGKAKLEVYEDSPQPQVPGGTFVVVWVARKRIRHESERGRSEKGLEGFTRRTTPSRSLNSNWFEYCHQIEREPSKGVTCKNRKRVENILLN